MDKFHSIFQGELKNHHGQDIIVEAVKILAVKRRDFKVVIFVKGTFTDELKVLIKKYQLEDVMEFKGWGGY